jgi:hypothetical protein
MLNLFRWENIIYQMGAHDLIKFVIVNGKIAYKTV